MNRIFLALLFVTMTFISSCSKEDLRAELNSKSRKSAINAPFVKPIATNGIIPYGNSIAAADLLGSHLTIFDATNGTIVNQWDTKVAKASPDDLVLLSDRSLVWTAPFQGKIMHTNSDGLTKLVCTLPKNVNPIAKASDDRYVYVGFSTGTYHPLLKIDVVTGQKTTVAAPFVPINGCDIYQDSLLYAPVTDGISLLGRGRIVKVNLITGRWEFLPLMFPNESKRLGFLFATGVVVGSDGYLYILESLDAKVYKCNLQTYDTYLLAKLHQATSDNITELNGKIYVSGFAGNKVFEVSQNFYKSLLIHP